MADETTVNATTEGSATESVAIPVTKLDQLKTLLAQMETLGTEVLQEEIASIKQKIVDEEAKIKAEVENVATEIKQVEATFVQKYGAAAAHSIEIILLTAILGKSLGVI